MSDRDRDGRPIDEDTLELRDSGDSLEAALGEEEVTALAAAEDKLRGIQKEIEELKDRHLRKLAEFENHKKRSERERQEYFKIALAGFAHDFLPILDNFERALAHARPEDLESDFGQGIAIIRKQLGELWKRYGLIPIDSTGAFDPNLHEAVATEKTDAVPANTIVEELQKGYFLNDRLIRPSFVKVAVRDNGGEGETPAGKK
ncbi:MAG TPA: nucleotide exchange factor GrpE [Thermoanaerobaculia bacterium]|nr:nucleotide exchange factor GrpE [Thermoanaerobaculia bacterium]